MNGFERMPFLAAVRQAKLRTFVSPGAMLSLRASIIHEGSGYTVAEAAVEAGGKIVADSELTFRIMPFPDPTFSASMVKMAGQIGLPVAEVVKE